MLTNQEKSRIVADSLDRFIHDHHSDITANHELVLRECLVELRTIAHAVESMVVEESDQPDQGDGVDDDQPTSPDAPPVKKKAKKYVQRNA